MQPSAWQQHCHCHDFQSTDTSSTITMVSTLDGALNLDTCIICLFLCWNIKRRTKCRRMQIRHFPTELYRQEVGVHAIHL